MRRRSIMFIGYICFFLLISLICGCAPSKIVVDEVSSSPPESMRKIPEEGSIEEIMARHYGKIKGEDGEDFEDFVSRLPSGNPDNVLFKMGKIYLYDENYEKSITVFQRILHDFPTSKVSDEVRFYLALSHFRLENFPSSIEILKSLLSGPSEKKKDARTFLLLARNYDRINDYLVAISWYITATHNQEDYESIKEAEDRVKEIINLQLSKNELLEVGYLYEGKFPGGYAQFKLARTYFIEKELEEASQILTRMLDNHPEHELRFKAQDLLSEINQIFVTEANTVGCILPLSGDYSMYGEKILRGIELAAGVFTPSRQGIPIEVILKDSRGDPEVAANAVEELALYDNVICIIGPLLSITSKAAAERAEKLKVPILVLSHERGIPEIGDYVFQNSLTPNLQIKAIVNYGMNELGLRKFAILYPDNHLGNDFMNLFWDEVLEGLGEIVGAESYQPDQTDFQDEIKKLVGLYYLEDRQDEIQEMKMEGDKEGKLRPIIDFDAIFIPDYYDKVGLIAPQLVYYDVVGIQLLGTKGWNSPQLIEMAGEHVQGAIFVDGFFKDSPDSLVREFVDDFRITFDEEPEILEAQAYDSAKIIIDLIRKKDVRARYELKEELLRIEDYPGVSGTTSFAWTGSPDKTVFTLRIEGRNIVQLR